MNVNGPDGQGPVQLPSLQNVLQVPVVAHVKSQEPPEQLMLQSASPEQVIWQEPPEQLMSQWALSWHDIMQWPPVHWRLQLVSLPPH
jgi:hypothetical protein